MTVGVELAIEPHDCLHFHIQSLLVFFQTVKLHFMDMISGQMTIAWFREGKTALPVHL